MPRSHFVRTTAVSFLIVFAVIIAMHMGIMSAVLPQDNVSCHTASGPVNCVVSDALRASLAASIAVALTTVIIIISGVVARVADTAGIAAIIFMAMASRHPQAIGPPISRALASGIIQRREGNAAH